MSIKYTAKIIGIISQTNHVDFVLSLKTRTRPTTPIKSAIKAQGIVNPIPISTIKSDSFPERQYNKVANEISAIPSNFFSMYITSDKSRLVIYKRGCYSLRFFLYDEGDWLTEFPIGTPRPQTNVSASLHHSAFDSASWDKSLLPFHGLI